MPTRYRSPDEDSARWDAFAFRDGDIVISTRSKSGTTWLQMICALLVFGRTDLPKSLGELSPWLDHLIEPLPDVLDRLEAQDHRRFVKTHTPLDGIPVDSRARYLVAARHPLDMAVSLYRQGENIDRERLRELTGTTGPAGPAPQRPDVHAWLGSWIRRETTPGEQMDSLVGVLHHVRDAWARQAAGEPVLLVHYRDLETDLAGEMSRIADWLGIAVEERVWAELVEAATFAVMRRRADEITPNPLGVLKDNRAFFARGSSGAGRELLSEAEYAAFEDRCRLLLPGGSVDWLLRP